MGFVFSSRRRHTRYIGDWSSDVCSSDLIAPCDPTSSSPMCDTSKTPQSDRTARCSGMTPSYCTGISQPANGTKIGRASCRERVEITLDAAQFEKRGKRGEKRDHAAANAA